VSLSNAVRRLLDGPHTRHCHSCVDRHYAPKLAVGQPREPRPGIPEVTIAHEHEHSMRERIVDLKQLANATTAAAELVCDRPDRSVGPSSDPLISNAGAAGSRLAAEHRAR